MTLPRLLLAVVLGLAGSSARAADKVTYDDHLVPILRDKCVGCHNKDKSSGGLALHTYTALMGGGSSGEVVAPGNLDESRLWLLVSHKQQPRMPPKSPVLPRETLDVFQKWIQGGALENTGSKARVVNRPKMDIALASIAKGKPEGPPSMPPTTLSLDPVVKTARANALTALACSPWAPLAAVAGQKQILLYNTDTLDLVGILPFPEGVPHVLKFSRNGGLLLAGGGHGAKQGKVVVWSVPTGERILAVGDENDAVLAADISADQTQIALGGPSKMIRVYSTKDGALIRETKKHTDWVYALEYSPDGVLLATADRQGGLFVWEAHTGREYFGLRGHTAAVTDLSWRADSNVLASASEDTTIRLWEMENGGQIKSWGAHGGGVQAVRYARDGRLVSCGRDLVAKVWDGNGAQQRAFEPFPDVALRCAFTHEGARVLAGDWSGQLRVWNAADGKRLGDLTTNPLALQDRLAEASKDLAARQAAHDAAVKNNAASQAAAQQAAAALATTQTEAADSAYVARVVAASVPGAKAQADAANAALAAAQVQLTAKDIYTRAMTEAAAKVKAEADKAKDNKPLAEAAAKAQGIAAQAAAELAPVQKQVADLTPPAQAANAQLAVAQRTAAKSAATADALAKQLPALTQAAQATAQKATQDKAALDQAAAALAAARAQFEKLKAAAAVRQQAKK